MSQDDFAFEPIRGLPERPPEGGSFCGRDNQTGGVLRLSH
jgi:hypothetical protein